MTIPSGSSSRKARRASPGEPADITKAKQNDRFAVVLKITEPKPEYGHVMVADYLPAGLEIDNPHLVSSGDSGTLDWIEDGVEAANTEFRDDRFTAAIDRKSDDKAVFTVAYVVRAVSPGSYSHPGATVEGRIHNRKIELGAPVSRRAEKVAACHLQAVCPGELLKERT